MGKISFTWLLYIGVLLVSADQIAANERRSSFAFFGGPSSPTTPLIELAQFKDISLANYYVLAFAYNFEILERPELWAIETEASSSHYLESFSHTSFQGALIFRWLATPWSKVLKSSAALGAGLSYAFVPPEIEVITLSKTNQLLFHLVLEFSFDLEKQKTWESFFRIHHRSGAYGLFNGVVGGSDYLCLGIRYRP